MRPFRAAALLRATRPEQWVKNLLLCAPLLVKGSTLAAPEHLGRLLAAILAFTAAAAAVYLYNDIADRRTDRLDRARRHRPVASGELPVEHATLAMLLLAVFSLSVAPSSIRLLLGLYLAVNVAYSAGLKHVPVLEILLVASGFALRVLAGAAAVHTDGATLAMAAAAAAAVLVCGKRLGELREGSSRRVNRFYRHRVLQGGACVSAVTGALLALVVLDAGRGTYGLLVWVPACALLARAVVLGWRGELREPGHRLVCDRVTLIAATCTLLALLATSAAGSS